MKIKSTSFCIEILKKKKSIISGDLKKEYKFWFKDRKKKKKKRWKIFAQRNLLPSIVSNDTIGPLYKHYSLGEEENCLVELC